MKSCSPIQLDTIFSLFFLIFMTLIFWITDLDIYLQKIFYKKDKGWFLRDNIFWNNLYYYCRYPGMLIFLGSALFLIMSYFFPQIRKYRKIALFLFLFLFIGAGVIINYIFKVYWGRPRPKQIKEFGGDHQYVRVWFIGKAGGNSSFPCGHASVAFYLIFPYFLLINNNPVMAYLFLALGLGFGILSGLGRMIQGGHFASDVLWAGGFMYLTGVVLYYILELNKGIILIN